MAKKSVNPLDALKEMGSLKETKTKSKIPVHTVQAEQDAQVNRYLDLCAQEKEIKSEKDLICKDLKDYAVEIYSETVIETKHNIPSSVRLQSSETGAALLYCVQDRFTNVNEEKLGAIEAAGLEQYVERKLSITIDDAPTSLQEKIARILMDNLSREELSLVIQTKHCVTAGALDQIIVKAKSGDEVRQAIEVLGPVIMLKQG
jgi:hypothetical protein